MKITKTITINGKTGIAAAINLITIAAIFLALSKLPPQVPLFYGMATGPAQLAEKSFLFLPPVLAFAALIVNEILQKVMKDTFIGSILQWSSLVFAILSSITIFRIMLLVGSF